MIVKSATVIFLVKVFLAQAQNTATELDVKNNPFFNKFFEEFQRQYEELQKNKTVTKPSPTSATYELGNNPFLYPQNTERPKLHIRRPSKPPTINPANPYFTASDDSIRPTRRPHNNPFLRTSTRTKARTSQNSLVDLSTEASKRNEFGSENFLKERFQSLNGENKDTKTGFLSFVQSALKSSSKPQGQRVPTTKQTSAQSVSDIVRKVVNAVPKSEVNTQVKQELRPTSTDSVFTTKSKVRNEYTDDVPKKQAENAGYTFTSDVQDSINGNVHQRTEQREGNKVSGMYTSEDGFYRRTVHYIADELGYRIVKEDVKKIGDGPLINPDGTAKVKANVAGNVVEYHVTNEDIQKKTPVRFQTIQEPKYIYY